MIEEMVDGVTPTGGRQDLMLTQADYDLLDTFVDGRITFGHVVRQMNVRVFYMTFGTVSGILKQLREAPAGQMFQIFYMREVTHEDGERDLEVRRQIFIRKDSVAG